MCRDLMRLVKNLPGLSKQQRKAMMKEAQLMDTPHSTSWRSHDHLAKQAGVSVSSVRRARGTLVKMGALVIVGKQYRSTRHGYYTNEYRFSVPKLLALQPRSDDDLIDYDDPATVVVQNGPKNAATVVVQNEIAEQPASCCSKSADSCCSKSKMNNNTYRDQPFSPFDDGGDWVLDPSPFPVATVAQSLGRRGAEISDDPQSASRSPFAEKDWHQAAPVSKQISNVSKRATLVDGAQHLQPGQEEGRTRDD